jgi:hypothetical protein
MSDRWLIRIEAWPFFSVPQAAAGERSQVFEVKAGDIREAFAASLLLQKGMQANPAVWQAPIREIRQLGHDEAAR